MIHSQILWAVKIRMLCKEGEGITFLANCIWFNFEYVNSSIEVVLFGTEDWAQRAINNHKHDPKIYAMESIPVQVCVNPLDEDAPPQVPRMFLNPHYPGNPGYEEPT